ncbi:uncharacterized protein A4U43_C03F1740 [Asparagus officinalis]|uniref:J domain-containing protein n=1 Tax=Asparagus officinalis TaxID=4686 RepID=A0A5P1F6L2_ASPOF|nr:uncharacterized protein A4U43_C03F1740 [Asparagus officinalis]
MKKEENFYEILSLKSERVGADAIKRAYRSMALQYHPDVCPPSKREEHTKMFIELQRAYKTLSDPITRRRYDCHLALGELGDEETEETTRGVSITDSINGPTFDKFVRPGPVLQFNLAHSLANEASPVIRCPAASSQPEYFMVEAQSPDKTFVSHNEAGH